MSSRSPYSRSQTATSNNEGHDDPEHVGKTVSGGEQSRQSPDADVSMAMANRGLRNLTTSFVGDPGEPSSAEWTEALLRPEDFAEGLNATMIAQPTMSLAPFKAINLAQGTIPPTLGGTHFSRTLGQSDPTWEVSPVKYTLDGRTHDLWILSVHGQNLLKPLYDIKIKTLSITAGDKRASCHTEALQSLQRFQSAVSEAEGGRREKDWTGQVEWPSHPDFGLTARFCDLPQDVNPLGWTLHPPQGPRQAWGGWSPGHSVKLAYTPDSSPALTHIINAEVIMRDPNRVVVEPTPYTRDGENFTLRIVTEQGHNLLGSLDNLKDITLIIGANANANANANDEAIKTVRRFAAYSHRYNCNKREAIKKYWTGANAVPFEQTHDEMDVADSVTLKGFKTGEELLSWTLDAPKEVWAGWYPEHKIEMEYGLKSDPFFSRRRWTMASVDIRPVLPDVD